MLNSFATSYNTMNYDQAYPKVVVTLPKSYLGYNTNNKYPQFPPKMADGRSLVSSWQPESKINDAILADQKITSNWMYRQHLQKNAKTIMENNFIETANDTGYHIPPVDFQKLLVSPSNDKNVPYLYTTIQDTTKPFGYQDSDLKDLYMTREQLNAMRVIPTVQMDGLRSSYTARK